MKKKQSLIEAENEARESSIKNPDVIYYVIDKKHGRAACYSLGWLAVYKINKENYFPVCNYRNGIKRNYFKLED